MKPFERRVASLERAGPVPISPAVKAWLGWPLTTAEQQALDDGGDDVEETDIDTSSWSQELKSWLGVE